MTRSSYILTSSAEADLRDIIRYTRKQWGLPRTQAPALVVAILHERMDLMARVADRLDE